MNDPLFLHEWFLSALKHFWGFNPGPLILSALRKSPSPNCTAVRGWTKGGCLVYAEATRRYIVRSLQTTGAKVDVSLIAIATDETEAAHVLVSLCRAEEEYFLDAAGVWTREILEYRLVQEYPFDTCSLVPWEQLAFDRLRIPFDEQIVQSIEVALTQVLGPFRAAYIFSSPVKEQIGSQIVADAVGWREWKRNQVQYV